MATLSVVENAVFEQAIKQGCLGVDLNSGVETAAGVKDSERVRSVFKTILSN